MSYIYGSFRDFVSSNFKGKSKSDKIPCPALLLQQKGLKKMFTDKLLKRSRISIFFISYVPFSRVDGGPKATA